MVELVLSGTPKNALSRALMERVTAEIKAAKGQPVLVRGDGDTFSAGLHLKELAALDAAAMAGFLGALEDMVDALFSHDAPLVAAIGGHAIAGGCVIALACDARVATSSQRARIGLNEVAIGLMFPPKTWRLVRHAVPPASASRVLLGGELFSPEQARALGLVDELADDPSARAAERLAELAAHPAAAYAEIKRAMRAGALDVSPGDRARYHDVVLPMWCGDELRQRLLAVLKR
ncbi:MAG: enoyl-CoA hydratase/isomerase family protein [Polyangiaceae bacterium]|nr:enoyl-CoA hydratase/isomerase family protein [Polyangiaceae bacterium]